MILRLVIAQDDSQDTQHGQISHPPNPGGYFTHPESAKTASSPRDSPCPNRGISKRSIHKGWLG